MSNSTSGGSGDHPEWDRFSRRHPKCPFLEQDPLYALSELLIDAIRHEIPRFFTDVQERFERDLTRTASFGFFLRRPFGANTDNGPASGTEDRQRAASEMIDAMLAEELRAAGTDAVEIDEYFHGMENHRAKISDRQDAYAGWLALNTEYRREVWQFRTQWDHAVRAAGRLPRLPVWLLGDPTGGSDLPSDFREACNQFFCRWGLETLLTWDWPVPMEPDLHTGLRTDISMLCRNPGLALPDQRAATGGGPDDEGFFGVGAAPCGGTPTAPGGRFRGSRQCNISTVLASGMVLFVPWYLLRGGKLDLGDVARYRRLAAAPEHLRGWVDNRKDGAVDKLGDVRYATVRWLYRFDELVLAKRYPAACKGNRQRLDRAFATVLGCDEDSVKKLQRRLQRVRRADGPNVFSS